MVIFTIIEPDGRTGDGHGDRRLGGFGGAESVRSFFSDADALISFIRKKLFAITSCQASQP
jgi:hypothetical protein